MKGDKITLVVFSLIIVLFSFFRFALASGTNYQGTNYQELLLNIYSQELVAHGAMAFAASAAAFTFITKMLPRVRSGCPNKHLAKRVVVLYILISGVLIGSIFYLGFRILYYGALVTGTTRFSESPTQFNSLFEYSQNVTNYVGYMPNEYYKAGLFNTTRRGFFDFNPFSILPVSIYIGLTISYVIFYSFSDNSLGKNTATFWLFYFMFPTSLGLMGIINYWYSRIYWMAIFFVLIYYLILAFLEYKFRAGTRCIKLCSKFLKWLDP